MFSFSEVLVSSSKETDLDVNAEKTKDMIWFRDQNAGEIHYI
jgi:hypothetical protein